MFHECYAYHEIRTRVLQLDDYVHLRYIRSMDFNYRNLFAKNFYHSKTFAVFSFRFSDVSWIRFVDVLL